MHGATIKIKIKKKQTYSLLERLSSRAQTEPPTTLMHVTTFTRASVSVDERLNICASYT